MQRLIDILDDAPVQTVLRVAHDPYVRQLLGHIAAKTEADHPVTDWHAEIIEHAREKHGASAAVAFNGMLICSDMLRRGRGFGEA